MGVGGQSATGRASLLPSGEGRQPREDIGHQSQPVDDLQRANEVQSRKRKRGGNSKTCREQSGTQIMTSSLSHLN